MNLFYDFPETCKEMFPETEENRESVIDLCVATGRFIEDFNLFNREELPKGDLLRRRRAESSADSDFVFAARRLSGFTSIS